MDLPSRARWAAISMKGTGSGRMCWFMEPCRYRLRSAGDAARPFARYGGRRPRRRFAAADRDFEAGDALVAGDRGQIAGADRIAEGDQFGAQRLIMADRQMAHRIGAVGLEAEALGDLARQQIAHDIFAAG